MHWSLVLMPGLLAAGTTMLSTPMVIRLSFRLKAMDTPGGRKLHAASMPRLGGLAIVVGIATSLGVGFAVLPSANSASLSGVELLGFLLAASVIFLLGLVDDIRGVGSLQKFGFQLLAASIIVGMGWQFSAVRLPIQGRFDIGGVASVLLTVLWIVGVTNAVNFIDGLDGLAAGIVAIISSSLMILAWLQQSPETVVVTSAITGACLGFLRHNRRPARVYMGDSGSLILGFLLATICLRASPSLKASTTVAILVPILALGLPIFDTVMVMWFRFLHGHRLMNRLARMFRADRAHIHHLLVDIQTERPKVVITLYGLSAVFCAMALFVATSGTWWLAVGFLVVEFAVVLLIRTAGLRAEARRLADRRMQNLRSPSDDHSGEI